MFLDARCNSFLERALNFGLTNVIWPVSQVHKIVDLSPFPDRESMWYLEVIEAFKLFYEPLFQEWCQSRRDIDPFFVVSVCYCIFHFSPGFWPMSLLLLRREFWIEPRIHLSFYMQEFASVKGALKMIIYFSISTKYDIIVTMKLFELVDFIITCTQSAYNWIKLTCSSGY